MAPLRRDQIAELEPFGKPVNEPVEQPKHIAIFVTVLAHIGGLMVEIDEAAFAVNSTCERGVRQEEMREALRRARLGRWSVKQLAEWVATPRPENPRDVQEGHGFDAGIVTAFKQIDLNSDNEISLDELEQALAKAESAEAAAEQTEVEHRSLQDLAAQAKKLMSQMDVRCSCSCPCSCFCCRTFFWCCHVSSCAV